MFSSTAYEAFYAVIGLDLHEASIVVRNPQTASNRVRGIAGAFEIKNPANAN